MMRAIFGLVLLLLVGSAAHATTGIRVENSHTDPDNKVDVELIDFKVGDRWVDLTQTVTIPPRQPWQWYILRACHDGSGGTPYIEVRTEGGGSDCPVSRVFTVVGTNLNWPWNNLNSLRQFVQRGAFMQHRGGLDFNAVSVFPPVPGDANKVQLFSANGCWPGRGLTDAVEFMVEAQREVEDDVADGFGLAQVNIGHGPNMVAGVANHCGDPSVHRSINGLGKLDQKHVRNWATIPIFRGGANEQKICYYPPSSASGNIYCHGVHLRVQPTVVGTIAADAPILVTQFNLLRAPDPSGNPGVPPYGGPASNLVDGDLTLSNSGAVYFDQGSMDVAGKWIMLTYATPTACASMTWNQSGTITLGNWKWRGSNDGATWTDLTASFTLGGSTQQTHSLSNGTTPYRYRQLLGLSGTTGGNPWVPEITCQ
jgi:hypothetical protein